MKFLFALIATLFLATPVFAVDVQMGYDGNLVCLLYTSDAADE